MGGRKTVEPQAPSTLVSVRLPQPLYQRVVAHQAQGDFRGTASAAKDLIQKGLGRAGKAAPSLDLKQGPRERPKPAPAPPKKRLIGYAGRDPSGRP